MPSDNPFNGASSNRPHPPVRSVVPAVCLKLSRSRGHDARAGPVCRPYDDLSMVQRYAPEIDKRYRPFLRAPTTRIGSTRRTCVSAGAWTYLYRGVDSNGDTLDFLLRATRDRKGGHRVLPQDVRRGSYDAPSRGDRGQEPRLPGRVRGRPTRGTLRPRSNLRQCKYLNNIIEQDHRFIKRRTRPMLGFKRFTTAWRTCAASRSCMRSARDRRDGWRRAVVGQTLPWCTTPLRAESLP